MRIAITGSEGSVGKRVVRRALDAGHTVFGIDTKADTAVSSESSFTRVQVDLRDYDATLKGLSELECDAIVQLAGVPHPDDYQAKAHNTNVVITWNVLRAAAELGVQRVAQASSVNVVGMVFNSKPQIRYLPVNELHPCSPDEPYGLSKLMSEMQADAIIQRFPQLRVASLRLHYSVPRSEVAALRPIESAAKDLWGWVQEDSAAEAFLLAVNEKASWAGHERFLIVAPTIDRSVPSSKDLKEKYWPQLPVDSQLNLVGNSGFYDCSKAKQVLGWVHRDYSRKEYQ